MADNSMTVPPLPPYTAKQHISSPAARCRCRPALALTLYHCLFLLVCVGWRGVCLCSLCAMMLVPFGWRFLSTRRDQLTHRTRAHRTHLRTRTAAVFLRAHAAHRCLEKNSPAAAVLAPDLPRLLTAHAEGKNHAGGRTLYPQASLCGLAPWSRILYSLANSLVGGMAAGHVLPANAFLLPPPRGD